MRCSNCGKDIPFSGNVCPYCHANKQGDQLTQVLGMAGGMAGGAFGWFVLDSFKSAFIGLLVGCVVGFVASLKLRDR